MNVVTEAFTQLCQKINTAKKVTSFTGRLLAIDPGQTTGIAFFNCTRSDRSPCLEGLEQITTWPLSDGVASFTKVLEHYAPSLVVYERYNIYDWKLESHSFSQVPTLQVIGCLETLCIQRGTPTTNQSAQQAKNFCTDELLTMAHLYQHTTGKKHARDALRHACYYLFFGASKAS